MLRIARRDAARSRGRTALIAVMVGLPVLAAVVIVVLLRSSTPGDALFTRLMVGEVTQARLSYHCPAAIVQDVRQSVGCSYDESRVQDPTLAEIEDDVRAVLGDDAGLVRLDGRRALLTTTDRSSRAGYGEVDLLGPVGGVFEPVVGDLPARAGEVLISSWLAEDLGVGVGEELGLRAVGEPEQRVRVTGMLHPFVEGPDVLALPGTLLPTAAQDVDLAPLAAQWGVEWWVTGTDPVTWDHVVALNDLGLLVRSRAVLADPPPRSAMPLHTDGELVQGGTSARTALLVAAVVGAGLLEAVLIVGPAFAVGARRSSRELALLAAHGGDRRDLRRLVLWNGVVIGLGASVVAAVLGVGAGAALVTWLPVGAGAFPNLVVPWLEILGLIALGTGIAAAAAWLPAHRACRVDVVAALSGRRAEAAPHHGVPVVGLVLLGIGTAAAVSGALRAQSGFAVAGVLLLLVGMVATSGAVVTLLGRVARWAPTALRFALRDTARQRGRTAPAVAAVIAAVAGATAGLVFLTSSDHHDRLTWAPIAAEGTVHIAVHPDELDDVDRAGLVARAGAAFEDVAPLATSAVVRILTVAEPDPASMSLSVWAERPVEAMCPVWLLERQATQQELADAQDDPRCEPGGSVLSSNPYSVGFGSVLVDDGTVVRTLGLPEAGEAAAALAGGAVLVNDAAALWADGTVHLTFSVYDMDGSGDPHEEELVLPGHVVGARGSLYGVVLPMGAWERLETLDLVPVEAGVVGTTTEPLARDTLEAATQAVADAIGPVASGVEVESPWVTGQDVTMLVVVAVAVVLGLAATWIAVGLAAAESRADLATLAAVGASPRTRRTVAGAQAGAIAGTGVVLGAVAGLLLGAVFVLVRRGQGFSADPTWQVVLPWAEVASVVIGLPALAVGAAMLLTRSRLPLSLRGSA
ncbi:ABC transporter permease [Actinotalea sp. K2]|uniref:FtsX-like permease family protein n=1 Tax=Actinotalea sp. K2 TaxID=2939438 RepID=UPI002017A9C1|nr:ABC transporter permease [Actinotalea sp. K2]MCL3861426.1 FtsX-like permease family protein [Actinotalea sp. K2]